MRFGDERSQVFEDLRIIDDDTFNRCSEIIRARGPKEHENRTIPIRTDNRGLLTGIIYCAHCGQRLTFCHQIEKKRLVDGSISQHERDQYKCYRKFSNRASCDGQTTYTASRIETPILTAVTMYFANLRDQPKTEALKRAQNGQCSVYEKAYSEAEKAYDDAFSEMHALEEEAMKSLTGKGGLDIAMVNSMLPRYRSKLESAKQQMENAKANLEKARKDATQINFEYDRMLSWADTFQSASIETKHMIMAALIDRVDIGAGYEMNIRFRIFARQFIGEAV